MTDEQMDARLRRAGEAWRTANPATDVLDADFEPLDITAPVRRRRMPRPGLLISAAAVAAALVAGVAVVLSTVGNRQHRSADVTALEGSVWRLVSFRNGQAFPNSTATLVFNRDGTFVADDSCEIISGSYELDHATLFANPHDLRDRSCTDAAGEMTFGGRGLDVLTGAPSYVIDGTDLTLHTTGETMHLRAAPNLPRPTLDVPTVEGATWVLVGAADSTGQPVPVRGSPTFVIKHHELRTSDGCNTLTGEADLVGNTLTTTKGGGLQSTAVGCQTAASNSAVIIDGVLNVPSHVSIRGATMTIRGDGGTLTYQWQPKNADGTDPALLESRNWHVTSVVGVPAAVSANLRITAAGESSGNDGCQAFAFANATVGHGTLQLSAPLRPVAGCDAPQASTIDSVLSQQPALWTIRDGKLIIFGGGPQAFSLVFAPDQPIVQVSAPPAIAGKPWSLSQISVAGSGSGNGAASQDSGVLLTIRTATFTLETNCHSYSGAVTRTAHKILFYDIQDLGGANCHDQFVDAAVNLVHNGLATWTITGGQLELVAGKQTLTFDG